MLSHDLGNRVLGKLFFDRHIADTKWSNKRYLYMQLLRQQELEKQMEVA
jgi:hypothetical protein